MAVVRHEPGAERVWELLPRSLASAVILVETLSKAANLGHDPAKARSWLERGGLMVSPVTERDIEGVVALYALAKRNVSLADRFCLALAIDRDLPLLTSDRPWAMLGLPVRLELFR